MDLKTKIVYLVSTAAFIRSFAQVIHTPSQVSMRQDLATSSTMVGMALSVYALVFAFSQIGFGPLVDRFEGKRILLGGMILFTIGSFGCYLAPSIGLLLVSRGLQAMGIAGAVAVAIALIADVIPPEQRGRALGTFENFNSAGAAAGPLIGAYAAVLMDWRIDFLILGLLGLGFLLFSWKQLPAQPVHPQTVGLAKFRTILRNTATFGTLVIGLVFFYGLFTNFAILPLLLTERLGIEVSRTGAIMALLPTGAITGTLIGGRVADRYSSRLSLISASIGATVAFGALAAVSASATRDTSLPLVALIIMACGSAIGFGLPALLKIMVDYYPDIRGTAGTLQVFARFIGATLAPAVTPYLADRVGLAAGFASAAVLLGFGGLLGFFLITDPKQVDPAVSVDKSSSWERV